MIMINKNELISLSKLREGYELHFRDSDCRTIYRTEVFEQDGWLYLYADYKDIEPFVKKEAVKADIGLKKDRDTSFAEMGLKRIGNSKYFTKPIE